MFNKLRDKLKSAVRKFSSKAAEDVHEEKVEDSQINESVREEDEKRIAHEPKTETIREDLKVEKKPQPPKKKAKPKPKEPPKVEEPERVSTEGATGKESEKKAEKEEPPKQGEKKGLFGRISETFTKKQLSEEKFDDLFFDLEIVLLESNVAIEVIEKIKQDLKDELTSGKVSRLGVQEMILSRLKQSIEELFDVESFDLLERIKHADKPYRICIIGVNGSGKTTSLAKLAHLFEQNNLSVCVAASDTFRAAAIDQLKEHTDKLGIKLISQGYNADPAAVAFDAIEHARAKELDVVLIDTAGRLHSNTNLMAELEKVVRVAKPDLKIFVGESITGNDCIEQAKTFDKIVGIDAIVLTKADIDEKGGAAVSISYVTGKPILYLGTGQKYGDLETFDKEKVIETIGLE